MKKPIRYLTVLLFLFIVLGTAFADGEKQPQTGVFNEQGERLGASIEEVGAAKQAKADAYREQTRIETMAAMQAAALPQTYVELPSSETAAEAARVAFIARGDFSPAAAIEYAKSTGTPFTVGAQPTNAAPTVTHNPVTLDGTPVGLSGFSEPTPPTPTAQSRGANTTADRPSSEVKKIEVVKVPEPARVLVSFEQGQENNKKK